MNDYQKNRFSEEECKEILHSMFPNGVMGNDVLDEIAPDGWDHSPLLTCFHPSVEKVYEECLRTHENLESLTLKRGKQPNPPKPTYDEVKKSYINKPADLNEEIPRLIGMAL